MRSAFAAILLLPSAVLSSQMWPLKKDHKKGMLQQCQTAPSVASSSDHKKACQIFVDFTKEWDSQNPHTMQTAVSKFFRPGTSLHWVLTRKKLYEMYDSNVELRTTQLYSHLSLKPSPHEVFRVIKVSPNKMEVERLNMTLTIKEGATGSLSFRTIVQDSFMNVLKEQPGLGYEEAAGDVDSVICNRCPAKVRAVLERNFHMSNNTLGVTTLLSKAKTQTGTKIKADGRGKSPWQITSYEVIKLK